MKELLLLTVSLLSFALKNSATPSLPLNDSAIKLLSAKDTVTEIVKVNPRDGFKDLFEDNAAIGVAAVRLNPMAINFVQDYMQRHTESLNKMKKWGKPYFDMMDDILNRYGLPEELKYLSVIESDLKSTAVSRVGAVGPWQFMPGTARELGLRVSRYSDERTDFYKSTHAAAKYLTDLYSQFGDWLLVIASYNCGPGVVNSAIRKSGSHNFWKLQYYLPEESRNHVKKFIATHYIMEGGGGETTLTKQETKEQLIDSLSATNNNSNTAASIGTIELAGGSKYYGAVIANYVQMSLTDFNKLNPNFDKLLSATAIDKSLTLKLPSDKILLFQANKMQILEQSMRIMLAM